ncbi:MAG: FecR domain-containing protein [Prevotella sp.]|nr:FecR domain-containing protein [Prevotella sp.]MBR1464352.1 FecR domain-containing protein [Prevotella sp.]
MNEKDLNRIRKEIAESTDLTDRYRIRESINEGKAWNLFLDKFNSLYRQHDSEEKTSHTVVATDNGGASRRRYGLLAGNTMLLRVAAVAVLIIVGGAFWYHRDYTRVTPPEISEEVRLAMQQSVESGRQDAEVETIGNRQSVSITQEEKALYHVDDDFAERLAEAKRITTHQSREFWVTLEDGTLVHLNYNSRLIYPEKFGDRRDVILDGEAYFMVAKDRSRQFVVHTPQGDVKVYGTEFNVNTHKEDRCVSVVLVSGSVGFTSCSGNETTLQPGQELTVENSKLSVRGIDTAPYVAWNEGKFSFQEWTLERVMEVMSRWYGYQVIFGNDQLRQIGISGKLGRYNEAETTMDAIATITDLKITISGNIITINP